MQQFMTTRTQRDNIEPMRFIVAVMVMPVLGLFSAVASVCRGAQELARPNSIDDGLPCFCSHRKEFMGSCCAFAVSLFPVVALAVFFGAAVIRSQTALAFQPSSGLLLSLFGVSIIGCGFPGNCFALFCLVISLNRYCTTVLAPRAKAIQSQFVFVKLRSWQNLLAFRTAFFKKWLRHSFTSNRVMLGPLAPSFGASGPSNSNPFFVVNQIFF